MQDHIVMGVFSLKLARLQPALGGVCGRFFATRPGNRSRARVLLGRHAGLSTSSPTAAH
jgi:hypothetical protein